MADYLYLDDFGRKQEGTFVAGSNITLTQTGRELTIAASGGGGIASGTSFPGSPSAGDLYHRTDRRIIYEYDGTRWLSSDPHGVLVLPKNPYQPPNGATTAGIAWSAFPDDTYSVYFLKVVFTYKIALTFDGTNNWTYGLSYEKLDGTGTSTIFSGSPTYTGSETIGVWYTKKTDVNAVYSPTNVAAFDFDITKNSSPGNIDWRGVWFWFRLVG